MPLNLDTSVTQILTRTKQVADPDNPGKTNPYTFPCDYDGNPLQSGVAPFKVFTDLNTGKLYMLIAEKIPSGPSSEDRAAAKAINELKPQHFYSADGTVHGFVVPAPVFDAPAAVAAELTPGAPVQEPAAA